MRFARSMVSVLGVAMLSGCVLYRPAPYSEVVVEDYCPPPRAVIIVPRPYPAPYWRGDAGGHHYRNDQGRHGHW